MELDSINKNQTCRLAYLPKGKKLIGLKWVFKLKRDADVNIIKRKTRLVAKGYVQQKGARLETIRLLLDLAAKEGWRVHHLDVKSAFLNGELQEEVYVSQPDGFVIKGKEHLVYRLNKALYWMRRAPWAWNIWLDRALKDLVFRRCPQDKQCTSFKSQSSCL